MRPWVVSPSAVTEDNYSVMAWLGIASRHGEPDLHAERGQHLTVVHRHRVDDEYQRRVARRASSRAVDVPKVDRHISAGRYESARPAVTVRPDERKTARRPGGDRRCVGAGLKLPNVSDVHGDVFPGDAPRLVVDSQPKPRLIHRRPENRPARPENVPCPHQLSIERVIRIEVKRQRRCPQAVPNRTEVDRRRGAPIVPTAVIQSRMICHVVSGGGITGAGTRQILGPDPDIAIQRPGQARDSFQLSRRLSRTAL